MHIYGKYFTKIHWFRFYHYCYSGFYYYYYYLFTVLLVLLLFRIYYFLLLLLLSHLLFTSFAFIQYLFTFIFFIIKLYF